MTVAVVLRRRHVMIQFPHHLRLPFQNALNGQTYFLVSGDQIEPSTDQLLHIARIANEPLVYDMLFRQRLDGAPYPESLAAEWIEWSRDGWRENTHFSFVVTDESGTIAAACDIKSADAEGAEVGYWASEQHRGVMTNAVKLMCQQAGKAGFRMLTARTRRGNARSRAVLHRVGFLDDVSVVDDAFEHYVLRLRSAGW